MKTPLTRILHVGKSTGKPFYTEGWGWPVIEINTMTLKILKINRKMSSTG